MALATNAQAIGSTYTTRVSDIRSRLWGITRELNEFIDRVEGNPTSIAKGGADAPASNSFPAMLNDIEGTIQDIQSKINQITTTI